MLHSASSTASTATSSSDHRRPDQLGVRAPAGGSSRARRSASQERTAVYTAGRSAFRPQRTFVVTNANLTGNQVAALYLEIQNRLSQHARMARPYIYGVYPGRLERLFPRSRARAVPRS
jgi:hypothetical protein